MEAFEIINVTHWKQDEHHAIFPIGARDKEMIWSPIETINNITPNWPYLFKESIDRYPDQFWTEIVAYIISKHLDINVPKAQPAVKDTSDGQVSGSLIEWFYDVKSDRFLHAGAYFKRFIPEFDDKTGKEHNIIDMTKLIRLFVKKTNLKTNHILWLADMILFDSLIGNTDRHQENWGVIFHNDNTSSLSPLFDNGTSLGHERFTDNIASWDDNRLTQYIKKGKHHLRANRNDSKMRLHHIESVGIAARADQEVCDHFNQKLKKLNLKEMFEEIEHITTIQSSTPFSKDRFNWIKRNIELRFYLIQKEIRK